MSSMSVFMPENVIKWATKTCIEVLTSHYSFKGLTTGRAPKFSITKCDHPWHMTEKWCSMEVSLCNRPGFYLPKQIPMTSGVSPCGYVMTNTGVLVTDPLYTVVYKVLWAVVMVQNRPAIRWHRIPHGKSKSLVWADRKSNVCSLYNDTKQRKAASPHNRGAGKRHRWVLRFKRLKS